MVSIAMVSKARPTGPPASRSTLSLPPQRQGLQAWAANFYFFTWVQSEVLRLAEAVPLAQTPGQTTCSNCTCIFLCWDTPQGFHMCCAGALSLNHTEPC